MVYSVKIRNKKYTSFQSLCEGGLETIKYYKGRTYPTVAINLDPIIREWFCNVNCPPNEKVYYRTTRHTGTRTYFVERVDEGKPVLKVHMQSTDQKQSRKTGTFEILSSHDELYKILNDSIEALRNNGKHLETAGYHREMSKYFDIGRDRLNYVLKWIHDNIEVDRTVSNTSSVDNNYDSCTDFNDDNVHHQYFIDHDNDQNDEEQTIEHDGSNDGGNQSTRKLTVAKESALTQSPVSTKKTKSKKNSRKRVNSELMGSLQLSQPKTLNRTLENLTIWNNKAAAFKTMAPLDRKQRRVALQRNQ
ncbi:unnamed protein product [Rotaria sordida]|uniref:Uncharacterized protein n=1 Tax=Rotaria sordida TaxID=392033 RepID=A0A819RRP5_9BILA|nr:unnamed protein product [Rotaria sordida]CAF4050449.1 unnamed protein product [Rotaria sordida]